MNTNCANHDQKRLRAHQRQIDDDDDMQRGRFSKGKGIVEQQPAILYIKVHYASDIDRAFRRVTNDRFYRVVASLGRDEVRATNPRRPDVKGLELDPVWREELAMPLGEERGLEEAVLRLEVERFTLGEDAPEVGPSSRVHLVGRGEMGLGWMPVNRWVKRRVQLMQPDEAEGWKPEGCVCVEVGLKVQHVIREKIY